MSLCDQLAHASGSPQYPLLSIPVWYALMGAAVWVVLGSSRLFHILPAVPVRIGA